MKKLPKILAGLATVVAVTMLAACGKSSSSSTDSNSKTIKIGLLQYVDQAAFDQTRKGFEQELAKKGYKDGKNIKIDYVNAQGDQSNLNTISQKLKKDNNDFNVTIGTAASQAMQKADAKAPILFTAISDPVQAGLVTNRQQPDKNATGVTDAIDTPMQIKMLHKMFPKAKTVGILYNASELNSQLMVKSATKAIKQLGLKVATKTVSSTNDVEQAATALAKDCDVMYIPNDNTDAAAMSTIGKVSTATKTPVVNSDDTMISKAGVATRGISFKQVGAQTADMAIKMIKGKTAKQLPVENPKKLFLVKNEKRMKMFGITDAQLQKIVKSLE